MQVTKNSAAIALCGTWLLLLTTFVMAALYLAQDILIPLALATLLTFLLAPIVTRLERWIGRIAAVLMVVLMLFAVTGFTGWVLTRQVIDLARQLPDYKVNIQTKLRSFQIPKGGVFTRFSDTVEELKKDLTGAETPAPVVTATPSEPEPARIPLPAAPAKEVEALRTSAMDVAQSIIAPLLGPLGTAALVLLLVIVMLHQREDLRSRLIRLIGQGRISATTHAMDDAGERVSRYLLMLLVVNVSYGVAVAFGLHFIGVPNAVLWGAFATVLRFIPYIGPWIAAAFPIILALAVSPGWTVPLLTIGLFVVLELLSNNVMEPWLYGSSTGVSPIALIVAAVFWTWLWGPVGLVLSTPLTVCLVVIGRHVPKLEFLSVLLSDEEALAPHEECYYRLLAQDLNKADELVETYLKTNSTTTLYDAVLIPVISAVEMDCRREALDDEQRLEVLQSVRDLVGEIELRPPTPAPKVEAAQAVATASVEPPWSPPCRILCLPAHAERDELAGLMLVQLLRPPAVEAQNASRTLMTGELIDLAATTTVDAVCISVVAPSTIVHARHLSAKLRARLPRLNIVVGLWGATENVTTAAERLRTSGADAVVVSLAEAVTQLSKCSGRMIDAPAATNPADAPVSAKK
ncbi:MAG: AI-2E family transporter [Prosthecobacter sp.]|uniref:AI-2E family transporter n=1 Tax=Prosthecobacter sp. TaxID=1965333 RepID=UPI00390179FF